MKRQAGVALVTALLVVALAVSAATAMALRGQADIRRTSSVFERDLARHIALGAEKMVLRLLEQIEDPADLPWDTCRSPVLPLKVDSVSVLVSLDDMRCRFNLNALAGADETLQAGFARLVDRVAQDSGADMPSGARLALSLTDWMDPEADDPLYRLQDPPRYAGQREMLFAAELTALPGMNASAWLALAPYVTAYPGQASPLDLSRADPVLQQVFAGSGNAQGPWFMRLEIVAEFADRRFYQCSLLDAPNGTVVVREQTACEP